MTTVRQAGLLALGLALALATTACSSEPTPGAGGEGADASPTPATDAAKPGEDAAGGKDAALTDAGAGLGDAGTPDANLQDASVQDASVQDASVQDAAIADAAPPFDAGPPPPFDAGPTPDAPIGPFLDAAPGCPPEPASEICDRLGANCGSVTTLDVCGTERTVACGTCPAGSVCGGGPAPNVCAGCTPESNATFCVRNQAQCGSLTRADNCGVTRTVSCGSCRRGEACSANNLCGCTPETNAAFCQRMSAECGTLTSVDNCGAPRTAACGTCRAGSTCGGDGVPNRCELLRICEPPASQPTLNLTPYVSTPAPFAQARCSSAQVSAFIDACLAPGSSASACTSWRSANAACSSCALTPLGGASWGPIVTDPAEISATNVTGFDDRSLPRGTVACLDHFRAGCGFAFEKHEACLMGSCDQTFGCNGATSAALLACRNLAQSTSCAATFAATYDSASGACRGVLATGPVSSVGGACVLPFEQRVGPTEAQMRAFINGLVLSFCGP